MNGAIAHNRDLVSIVIALIGLVVALTAIASIYAIENNELDRQLTSEQKRIKFLTAELNAVLEEKINARNGNDDEIAGDRSSEIRRDSEPDSGFGGRRVRRVAED